MKSWIECFKQMTASAALLAVAIQPVVAQTRPVGATTNRPTTLPAKRPPQPAKPPRPPISGKPDRPTTLPSYPDRPHLERPHRPVRPPVVVPGYRPGFGTGWGYHYPSGGRYFAGNLRCDSFGGRFRSCAVRTQGHVVLERRHNGRCRYGNGWGYDRNRIWVKNNCRATFAYGYGNYVPRYRRDDNDALKVIAGVAVAAGLIAILSDSGRNSSEFPPQQSVPIAADLSGVRASARPALRACLDRASSNVGATGGSSMSLTNVLIDDMGSETYRFDVDVKAKYPDRSRNLAFSCTAKGSEIDDFDFVTEAN